MKVRKKFPSKVACVHCNGGCRANQSPEGYDLCLYGCTGCGACMEVCRFGAISLNSYGVAEVDESRCIGCGACYRPARSASSTCGSRTTPLSSSARTRTPAAAMSAP